MPNLEWRGAPAPSAVVKQLRAAGWRVSTDGDGGRAPPPSSSPSSPPMATVVRGGLASWSSAALPRAPWIWVVDDEAPAVAALQSAAEAGALDVICAAERDWGARLLRRLSECVVASRQAESPLPSPEGFVAQSSAARRLLEKIGQAARTSMPVLLTGETGTGKELVARLIHQWSARRERVFVPINCAAIPNELMEAELFGYAKGSFSGAERTYDGLVAVGEGGTVFFDEIDDTPHALQQKLLRVLEDRVVQRIGESVWRKVDFRILAATNRDLKVLIEQGAFGQDLFERLATVQIELPPLRERLEDFDPLVRQLIDRYYSVEEASAHRTRVRGATPETIAVLQAYPWPGNVRELKNVIFGALVTKREGDELLVSDLPRKLWKRESNVAGVGGVGSGGVISSTEVERAVAQGTMNLRAEIERLERMALEAALRRTGGNAAAAAKLLGEVGRGTAKDPGGTVRTMMKRLGIAGAG